jgi:hypothetical protein
VTLLQARVATQQEELVEMRKKFERSRGDLKQRTVDVHMLQVTRRAPACIAVVVAIILLVVIVLLITIRRHACCRCASLSCAAASSTA